MLSGPKILLTIVLVTLALIALKFLTGRSAANRKRVEEAARKATRARITDLKPCPRCGTHTSRACTDPECPV